MARTLPAKVSAAVAQLSTTPIYLVELQFSSTLRYSTFGTITWNGQTWIGNGITAERLTPEGGRLVIPNQDLVIGAVVLAQEVRDKPVLVWQLYGDPPYAVGDAVALFSGVVDGVPEIGQRVALTLASISTGMAFFPREIVAPPTFNHLPPQGTVITWGGDRYTLEGR